MHLLTNLSGVLLTNVLGSIGVLSALRRLSDWESRRLMQLLVLAMPLVTLIVLVGGFTHISALTCIISAPLWDHSLDVALFILMSATLLGALLLGAIRLFLMKRLMRRKELLADALLQARADQWAHAQGLKQVRVRLSLDTQPLALLYGIRRPTILLSTWMLEQLDEEELEAVLTHELAHVSRSDYLVNWIAMMLRDAFFYLPTSRRAYRQFHHEKELACDDVVVQTTHRPLALASALTKVWLSLVDRPPASQASPVQALVGHDESITIRVERLLGHDALTRKESSAISLRITAGGCITLLVLVTFFALAAAKVLCWPGVWL